MYPTAQHKYTILHYKMVDMYYYEFFSIFDTVNTLSSINPLMGHTTILKKQDRDYY